MTPSEKIALVELLNAHSSRIITVIGGNPGVRREHLYDAAKRVETAELKFLAEPEEGSE